MGIYRGANYHGILRLREIYELNENSHTRSNSMGTIKNLCSERIGSTQMLKQLIMKVENLIFIPLICIIR